MPASVGENTARTLMITIQVPPADSAKIASTDEWQLAQRVARFARTHYTRAASIDRIDVRLVQIEARVPSE